MSITHFPSIGPAHAPGVQSAPHRGAGQPGRRRLISHRAGVLFALSCAVAIAGPLPAQSRPAATTPSNNAAPLDVQTRVRDAQRDEAIAGALVAALEQELGGRRIRLRLDPAQVGIASVRDRVVEGSGAVLIGDGEEWIGLHYRVLYDAVMGTTGYPELHLGGMDTGGRVLPNDASLVSALDGRVLDLVALEFGHQQARMQLDRIVTVETGSRYLRIDAEGMVDFGRDGTAPVRVEGLFDRIVGDWLRVAYALQPMADTAAQPTPMPLSGSADAVDRSIDRTAEAAASEPLPVERETADGG